MAFDMCNECQISIMCESVLKRRDKLTKNCTSPVLELCFTEDSSVS
jgi:hypothetical protein